MCPPEQPCLNAASAPMNAATFRSLPTRFYSGTEDCAAAESAVGRGIIRLAEGASSSVSPNPQSGEKLDLGYSVAAERCRFAPREGKLPSQCADGVLIFNEQCAGVSFNVTLGVFAKSGPASRASILRRRLCSECALEKATRRSRRAAWRSLQARPLTVNQGSVLPAHRRAIGPSERWPKSS